jgi:hypothetical protein
VGVWLRVPRYYRRGGECLKCPSLAWILIVVFIVAAVGLCLVGYFLSRKQIHLAFLSIGVDYFQVWTRALCWCGLVCGMVWYGVVWCVLVLCVCSARVHACPCVRYVVGSVLAFAFGWHLRVCRFP